MIEAQSALKSVLILDLVKTERTSRSHDNCRNFTLELGFGDFLSSSRLHDFDFQLKAKLTFI